jgi:5'-methylthioadenosine phosphorylase
MRTFLGIIGGSGLYDLPGLSGASWTTINTPWGPPSDDLLIGELGGIQIAFLPRHGRGHKHSPTGINYRANIDAMKRVGVTDLVSLSACGSLKEDLSPGTFVLVDQFVDRTFSREKSFFGNGCVAYVSFGQPVSPLLVGHVAHAAELERIPIRRGGTYLAMEGPQFSTLAESKLYRAWGCDVIGMTNMPEAKLAREAELCYAAVAMVTDYDSWHAEFGPVDVSKVITTLLQNADVAKKLVLRLAHCLPQQHEPCPIGSDSALEYAILTSPEARDPTVVAKLDAVAGRVLKAGIRPADYPARK